MKVMVRIENKEEFLPDFEVDMCGNFDRKCQKKNNQIHSKFNRLKVYHYYDP